MKVEKVFCRTEHNYDRDEASLQSGTVNTEESLTKQSFAEDADINTIVARFRITGELPRDVRMPTYGDFTGVHDFHSAMNAVAKARESFEQMPADIRARFNNDPQRFVEFCSDDKNYDEAKKLGLVKPEAQLPPAAALVSQDAAPSSATPAATTTAPKAS